MEMTRGRGPDRCIDAVGTEAHGRGSFDAVLDKAKAALYLATDRAHMLRKAIMCCRKGGTVSIPGVYVRFLDKIPFGAAMNKGLTEDRPDERAAVSRKAAGENRGRRDRPCVRHYPPPPSRSGSRRLQDVPVQAGRLHQGGAEALRFGTSGYAPGLTRRYKLSATVPPIISSIIKLMSRSMPEMEHRHWMVHRFSS
jgi:hypothetical protein